MEGLASHGHADASFPLQTRPAREWLQAKSLATPWGQVISFQVHFRPSEPPTRTCCLSSASPCTPRAASTTRPTTGALALESIFGIDLNLGIWLIGILAGGYTIYGGLKAVVWSDLIQGVALLLGGVVVTVLGFKAIGGVEPFLEAADGKLHTVLPWNHPEMPWLAVFVGGLWIPNLFYWGLNQFITQRTLAARSLADGQRGIFLAGFIKLGIPFIIVFPGIMAAELFADQVTHPSGICGRRRRRAG